MRYCKTSLFIRILASKKNAFVFILIYLTSFTLGIAQPPIALLHSNQFSETDISQLKSNYSRNKIIPAKFEKQILVALSYFPELKNTSIVFRIKHTTTPLASRPGWTSVLRNDRKRTYVITISDSSKPFLTSILLDKMDFNAQIGVMGHELSHVVDFKSKNSFGLLRVGLGNLSSAYLDRFEYQTDSICIAHGLGYQLLAWSVFVRKAFNWPTPAEGEIPTPKKERYMSPETIRTRMNRLPAYDSISSSKK